MTSYSARRAGAGLSPAAAPAPAAPAHAVPHGMPGGQAAARTAPPSVLAAATPQASAGRVAPVVRGRLPQSARPAENHPAERCHACGQAVPAPPGPVCECGHPQTGHHNTKAGNAGNWTYCCFIEGRRQCPCKVFSDARGNQ